MQDIGVYRIEQQPQKKGGKFLLYEMEEPREVEIRKEGKLVRTETAQKSTLIGEFDSEAEAVAAAEGMG